MKRRAKIFYGWWIVVACLVMDAVGHGAFQKAFTIYFLPIQRSLGLSRAGYSQAELLGRLAGAAQAPMAGYLFDRVGPSPMMVAGGLILGLGFVLLGYANSYGFFLFAYVALLSVGSRVGFNNASSVALNQWFRRKRSLVMSVVSTGQGLGGVIFTPLVTLAVLELGWRPSVIISGIVIVAVVVPLAFLVKRSPETMGLLPDGDRSETPEALVRARRRAREAASGGQTSRDADFTVNEAMATPSYWLFTAAAALRDAGHAGVRWHLAPLMVWSGVSLRTAGFLISLMSLCTLLFNPVTGWLGDSWSKQKISSIGMTAGVVGLVVLLAGTGRLWELVLFTVLLAFSETSNPLNWAIMGDFFGRTSYGRLRGWQHVPNHLISMPFPWLVGLIFDRTDSYYWGIVLLAAIYGGAAFFYWTLPRPKAPVRPLEASAVGAA
ncbi:MAG: MFS transporter [Dehalococcoidia bacterium]|nr:MFS transporter [Dehalococcoidia bacterium]